MSRGGIPISDAGGGAGEGSAWSQEAVGPVSGDGPPNVDAAFKLEVEEGATVSATFPFFGDLAGGQLSFQIGDHIKVRENANKPRRSHSRGFTICWPPFTELWEKSTTAREHEEFGAALLVW